MTMIPVVFGFLEGMINTQVLNVADYSDLQVKFRLRHGRTDGLLNKVCTQHVDEREEVGMDSWHQCYD